MKALFTISDPVVPMQHPRLLVETAESQGADRKTLIGNAGLTDEMLYDPDARISYITFGRLTHAALTLTDNPALGLDFGRRLHVGNLGMLGLAVMTSPNIGAGLEVALQFYRTHAPAWDLTLGVEGSVALLTAVPVIEYGPMLPFATEALLAAMEGQGRFLLGRELPLLGVELGYGEPPHSQRYKELTDAPIAFDRGSTRVRFEAAVLGEPIRWSDPIAVKEAVRQCAAQMSVRTPPDGIVGRVRQLLRLSRGRYPTESVMAAELETSPRSLRRGLRQMSTSYQALLDEDRKEQALVLLRTTLLPAEAIATRLGFSDVRSFRRAFKRWTGKVPSAYRSRGPSLATVADGKAVDRHVLPESDES